MKRMNEGMTLVEIMVTLGIMGAIAVGVTSLSQTSSKQVKETNQNVIITKATNQIQEALSKTTSCNAIIPSQNALILQKAREYAGANATGNLGDGVFITAITAVPPTITAIPAKSTTTHLFEILIQFEKKVSTMTHKTVRAVNARIRYNNAAATLTSPIFAGCAEYEGQAIRSTFKLNCENIGGTFVDSTPYSCDVSNIDSNSIFADKVRKDLCYKLFGSDLSSYDGANKKCQDMIIASSGPMTTSNAAANFIALNGSKRTTFNQATCTGQNKFINKININGTVNCVTLSFCTPGSASCPNTIAASSKLHCQTRCDCSLNTQAENGPGPGTGVPKNLCPATKTNSDKCIPIYPAFLPDGGTLTTGQYSGDFNCSGLNCRYKDYLSHSGINGYDRTSVVTLNVQKNLSQAGTCSVTNTYTMTAGLCQMFDSTTVSNYTTKYSVGHANGSFSGLTLSNVAKVITAPNGTSCGTAKTCTSGVCQSSLVNGECNTTHFNCVTGTSINNVTTASSYTWSCQGSGGGTTASCSESIIDPLNCIPGETKYAGLSNCQNYATACRQIAGTTTSYSWQGGIAVALTTCADPVATNAGNANANCDANGRPRSIATEEDSFNDIKITCWLCDINRPHSGGYKQGWADYYSTEDGALPNYCGIPK